MDTMASQMTSLTVVYSTVYSDADQRKHQSSASLAFVLGIHRDRWIHRTKGQLRGKCFHLMTSSWICAVLMGRDYKNINVYFIFHKSNSERKRFATTWSSYHMAPTSRQFMRLLFHVYYGIIHTIIQLIQIPICSGELDRWSAGLWLIAEIM